MYLTYDSPYSALLWNEDLFSPVVNLLGMEWTEYANNSDFYISLWEKTVGIFLISSSILFLTIKSNSKKVIHTCLRVTGALLLFHIFLHYLGHNHELPIIPEYMIQGLMPWLFLAYLPFMPQNKNESWQQPNSTIYFWTKVAISFCFLGHGLYAFGIPYQPTSFVRLLTNSLFIEYEVASGLVQCIGLADIVLAILIFIKPVEKISLGHIAFWGFITAFSRVLAYVIIPGKVSNINPWFFESTVRIVHGSLPFFLLLMLKWKIIAPEMPSFKIIKSWFLKWPSTYAMAFVILFTLAELSANGKFSTPNKSLVEKYKSDASKTKNKVRDKQSINISDFKKSSQGYFYSDELFTTEKIPIRFKYDCSHLDSKELLPNLNTFIRNSPQILDCINQYVVEEFYRCKEGSVFKDREIVSFTEKVILTYDSGNTINACIHVPWLAERTLNIELSSSGEIQ